MTTDTKPALSWSVPSAPEPKPQKRVGMKALRVIGAGICFSFVLFLMLWGLALDPHISVYLAAKRALFMVALADSAFAAIGLGIFLLKDL